MNFGEVLRRGLDRTAVACRGPREILSLVEKQNGMRVELDTEGWRVTAIDVQKNCHPKIVTGRDWRKLCDYLLLCEAEERVEVFLVELKQRLTPAHEENALEQLRRSLPVWRYLSTACAVQEEVEESPGIPVRYAAVYSHADEHIAKEGPRIAGQVWTTTWHGIRVREIVAGSVGLSDLGGSAAPAGAPPP